jgi:hypothetical protein
MRDRNRKEGWFSRKLMMGLILMTLGVVFYLHNIQVLDLERLWRFWPLLLGALALERFINRGPLAMEGHVLVLVGLGLQLMFLERYSLIERWWPLAVVWVGIIIVLRSLFPGRRRALCQDSEERPS